MGRGGGGIAAPITSSGTWVTPSGGNDTTTIQALIDDGGGFLGPGTFLAAGIVIKDSSHLRGIGMGQTTIKLIDGSDGDLFTTYGFDDYTGGTTRGGPDSFGLYDLTIDGNTANNSSGWPLRIFGSRYTLQNVEVLNGASGGIWSEWGTGGSDMEASWMNFRVHDCDGVGVDFRGPHDSVFLNGFVFKNTGNGIQTGHNATSELFTNVHSWGTEQDWAWYCGACSFLANCSGEGGSLGQLMLGVGGSQVVGGTYFGTNTGAEVGIQIGDASHSSVSSLGVYGVYLKSFAADASPLNFYSSGGGNVFLVTLDPTTYVTAVIGGSRAASDEVRVRSSDAALAAQSRMRQYGTQTIDAPGGSPANTAFTIKNSGGNDRFNFNAAIPKLEINAAGSILFYSGTSYTGQTIEVNGSGYIDIAETADPAAPAANTVRLYAKDTGGGKTALYALFPSGATQQIKVEP